MNQKQQGELMRELSSLPPETDQRPQFSGIGLSGIRNNQEDDVFSDNFNGDMNYQLNRSIEFQDEYSSDDDELNYAIHYPEQFQDNELVIHRQIRFEDQYEDSAQLFNRQTERAEPQNDISRLRSEYGATSRFSEDDEFEDPRANTNSNLVYDNATITNAEFASVEFEDPRGGTESILYDNVKPDLTDDEQESYNDIQRVYVTNFLGDLLVPINHALDSIEEHEVHRHKELTSVLSNILRANLEGNDSTESSFMSGLKFQYDLFMRHPIWNSLVGIQKYLISPAFKLIGGLLFGFKKKSSIEEQILDATKKQTEFMMTGEIGGRGFFQKIIERGVVGTTLSAVAYPFMQKMGLSQEEAQRREDTRSRGEKVDGGLGNWLNDKFRKGDITKRGRNGLGNEGEAGYKSGLEKVGETDIKDIPSIILNLFKRKFDETGFDELTEDVNLEDLWDSIRRDRETESGEDYDGMGIKSLEWMSVGSISSMLVQDANIHITDWMMQDSDKNPTKVSTSNRRADDSLRITQKVSEFDMASLSPLGNINSGEKEKTPSYTQSSDITNRQYKNPKDQEFYRKLEDIHDILKTSLLRDIHSSGTSIDSPRSTDNPVAPSVIDLSFLSRITKEDGLITESPDIESIIHKDMEFSKLVDRNQQSVFDEERTHREASNGILGDINKHSKKTAKETEKTRKQGIWRMLFGLAGSLIGGLGSIISGVAGVAGTIITTGVSIVGALWATKGGGLKRIKDLFTGGGKKNKGRPTSPPKAPKVPNGGKAPHMTPPKTGIPPTPKAPPSGLSRGMGAASKIGGVAAIGMAGMQAKDIWTDDDATVSDKFNSTTELAGTVGGGWAGAKLGAAAGAAAGAGFLGIGAVPGAIIGALGGGLIGSYAGGKVGASVGDTVFGEKSEKFNATIDYPDTIKSKDGITDIPELKPFGYGKKKQRMLDAREQQELEDQRTPHTLMKMLSGIAPKPEVEAVKPKASLIDHPYAKMFGFGGSALGDIEAPTPVEAPVEQPTYLSAGLFGTSDKKSTNLRDIMIGQSGDSDDYGMFGKASQYDISDALTGKSTFEDMMGDMGDVGGFNMSGITDSITSGASSLRGMIPDMPSMSVDSSRLDAFGSDITKSIKTLTDSLGDHYGTIAKALESDDPIKAIQNSKMSMDLQNFAADNTLNMSEAGEISNKFLKSIEKTLSDMLSLQKHTASEEPAEDNSGIMNNIKRFITGD